VAVPNDGENAEMDEAMKDASAKNALISGKEIAIEQT
jgi:hypothetical protein